MARGPRIWALILAGGDGTRLQELTRTITGAPIPKQYCRIVGGRSLLEATLARISPLAPPARTLVIVNRNHLDLVPAHVRGLPPSSLLVQPENRDTGPGLLFGLLALAWRSPRACVAVFPSDHFVAEEAAFLSHVRHAARLIDEYPDKIALLGIRPTSPESGLGYVEPSLPLRLPDPAAVSAFHVRAFWEKPSAGIADRLVRRGALWNSFVMVFRVQRMLALLRCKRPGDVARMRTLGDLTAGYASLARWNFSSDFLTRIHHHLLVLPVDDVTWTDWGTPEAVERTFATLNEVPPWRQRLGPRPQGAVGPRPDAPARARLPGGS